MGRTVAQAASALFQLVGVVWTKPTAPLPNRFIGNLNSKFCQKIFDVAETEAEPVVQPNGVADDFWWEPMSVIQWFCVLHGRSLPNLGLT